MLKSLIAGNIKPTQVLKDYGNIEILDLYRKIYASRNRVIVTRYHSEIQVIKTLLPHWSKGARILEEADRDDILDASVAGHLSLRKAVFAYVYYIVETRRPLPPYRPHDEIDPQNLFIRALTIRPAKLPRGDR